MYNTENLGKSPFKDEVIVYSEISYHYTKYYEVDCEENYNLITK